jgi:hypothetical protein
MDTAEGVEPEPGKLPAFCARGKMFKAGRSGEGVVPGDEAGEERTGNFFEGGETDGGGDGRQGIGIEKEGIEDLAIEGGISRLARLARSEVMPWAAWL